MPLLTTRANASAGGYGWSSGVGESLDGMVLMTPTSVTAVGTGSSATIGANGSVTYTSCDAISLNNVFTTDYDNYIIIVNLSGGNASTSYRLRANGTDNSTTSSYVSQELLISGTGESTTRSTTTVGSLGYNSTATLDKSGFTAFFYGPSLAQPTATRTVSFLSTSSAAIYDFATTHNQSTSYDGLTIQWNSASSGTVSVYGLEN